MRVGGVSMPYAVVLLLEATVVRAIASSAGRHG